VLRCFKGLEAAIHCVICGVIQWMVHVIGSSSEVWLLSELDCRDRDLSYPTLLSTNQQIRTYSARGRAMKEVEEEEAKRRKTLLDTHTRLATAPRKPSLLMALILTQLRAPLARAPPLSQRMHSQLAYNHVAWYCWVKLADREWTRSSKCKGSRQASDALARFPRPRHVPLATLRRQTESQPSESIVPGVVILSLWVEAEVEGFEVPWNTLQTQRSAKCF